MDMPHVAPLVEKWGEPDSWRLSWWDLLPGILLPPFHPCTVWKWRIEDKEVTATIDHPLAFGWHRHVWRLRIEEAQTRD
jgi:hypothetical protein